MNVTKSEIKIELQEVNLGGNLEIPIETVGLVIFAHGSGSSRHSPRNQWVAQTLHNRGIGTLLFDLMSLEEEQAEAQTRHLRFNIPFLADRLVAATHWVLEKRPAVARELNIGYFGSSTGAAAALVASAELGQTIHAVVSRGGRPDLAGDSLEAVKAPTLLLVGGEDKQVIKLNQEAYDRLPCEKALRIIPGATHLFEEPGALETVAKTACAWFSEHLQPISRAF